MDSQQKIHKMDLSEKEMSVDLYMDMFCSDLQEQIQLLIDEKDKNAKDMRLIGLMQYVRGVRDGNRFNKHNPVK